MKKEDIIKYAAIAGGAYLVYWYITNYGPTGAVSTGAVSYWNTWFGAATPVPSSVPGTMATMAPVTAPPNLQAVVTQPVNTPSPASSQVRSQMLAASASDPAISGGYAIPDVWSYYWQKVTGQTISGPQMSQMFPPAPGKTTGAPLNIDQFLAQLPGVGLSGMAGMGAVVSVPSAPSLPSMSFGGSFRQPGMRGMGGRGLKGIGGGGQTIQ